MSSGSAWNQEQQAATLDHRNAKRVPYTEGEDQELIRLRQAGKTWLQIATGLERTWHSVQGRWKYLKAQGYLTSVTTG